MPRKIESVTDLRVGDFVRFRDPIHARYWFLDPETVGTVISIRGHLVTARFGARTVTGSQFDLVVRAAP